MENFAKHNTLEKKWSPEQFAREHIQSVQGVFTNLNQKWKIRGIKLSLMLAMVVVLHNKFDQPTNTPEQKVSLSSIAQASLEDRGFDAHTTVVLEPEFDNEMHLNNEEEVIPEQQPNQSPVSPQVPNEHQDVQEGGASTSIDTPLESSPEPVVTQEVVSPQETSPVIDQEAISKMNQEAYAFVGKIKNPFKKNTLVNEVRDNYDALTRYIKGETQDVPRDKVGENFKDLVDIFGRALNSFDSSTRKAASGKLLEMLDIVKNTDKLKIEDELTRWASKLN